MAKDKTQTPSAGLGKPDPLDHDHDGRKGGSLPKSERTAATTGGTEPPPGSASEDEALRALVAADETSKAAASGDLEQSKSADTPPGPPALGAAPDGGKPSNVETFERLGQGGDDTTEKTDSEIAADLQANMAARLPEAQPSGEEEVRVTVPRGFFLRLDNHQLIAIKAGARRLPRSHAEHIYSKANGVTLDDAISPEAYDEAAAGVASGMNTIDYTVNAMSSHFKVDLAIVRAELTARVEKLKGAQ